MTKDLPEEDGLDPLVVAARAGDLDEVRRLVEAGSDPWAFGVDFGAAVETALERGEAEWLRRNVRRMMHAATPHANEARARAVAESLGTIALVSTSVDTADRPLAWGFHVESVAAAGAAGLALGVSAASPTLVFVAAPPERGLSSTVLAKEIARVFAGELRCGEAVDISKLEGGPGVDLGPFAARFELVQPRSQLAKLDVPDAVFARPDNRRSLAVQRDIDQLERIATRLKRLIELDAPQIIIDGDRKLLRRTLDALEAKGWSPATDPLPDAIASVIAEAAPAPKRKAKAKGKAKPKGGKAKKPSAKKAKVQKPRK